MEMKLPVLVFLFTIAVSNISISFSSTHDQTLFELISIDNLLTQHDPSLTPQDRRGLLRTEARQRLFSGDGSYFIRLGVGTPPQNVYMSLDTGSDISWIQCLPCSSKKSCYNQSDPIFDPKKSSTFSQIACGSPRCKQLLQTNYSNGCGGKHKKICLYNATYSDLSFSQGAFSTETLTLGNTMELRNISLGCGHDNRGWFTGSAGVLGLGRGNLSFIMQTGDRSEFRTQFSYCLGFWYTNSSKSSVVFGPSAVTGNAVYTPLIHTNAKDTYYYVNLTGISVDGTPVPDINSSVFDLKPNGSDGGVILDSGTDYTRLVKPAYKALRKAFRAAFQKQKSTVGSPLKYLWFDTCYNISRKLSDRVEIPTVELHFDKGANMTLGPDNTVILMDGDDKVDTVCFAFMPNGWYTTIGSFQQQGFRIVYDLPCGRVGFVPDSC